MGKRKSKSLMELPVEFLSLLLSTRLPERPHLTMCTRKEGCQTKPEVDLR